MNSTGITSAGAFIEGAACEPIWRILRDELARRQRDGGGVRPAVQRALDALREGAQAHLALQAMFANAPLRGAGTNMASESTQETNSMATTQQMADRLRVTPTHARRLATQAGIEPLARNVWRTTDVDALVLQRRTA